MTNVELVQQRLEAAFPQATITVTDIRGDDNHLSLHMVWAEFAHHTTLARHRMIYHALEGLVGGQVHALTISAQVA